AIGRVARASQPYIQQIFVARPSEMDEDAFERKLYVVRKRAEKEVSESDIEDKEFFYIPSMSTRTIVYKGLLLAPQISHFYPELKDPEVVSALCLVHQRFSTNTFPTWQLAHPYRYIAHNGEINTLRGNVNWMHARQSVLASPLFGDDIKKLFRIIQPGGSDSAAFDNALELLVMPGHPADVKVKGRPHPGKMLMGDTGEGRIISGKELNRSLYGRNPYQLWINENQITLHALADPPREHCSDDNTLVRRQRAFGY